MSKKNRVPVNLVQLATQLAAQTSLWEPLVDYDPVSRYYARLARESDFEAWLLTWVPGQGTEWHDHGGSAGAFITVRGVLTEEHAVVSPDGPPRVVPQVSRPDRGHPATVREQARAQGDQPVAWSRRSVCTSMRRHWLRCMCTNGKENCYI